MIVEKKSGAWSLNLSEKEKSDLLAIARDTLEWCAAGRKGKFAFDKYDITANLKQTLATFVTLKIGHELRGCMGTLVATDPLYLSAHENAVSAAARDPRFQPVSKSETGEILISVSVLSPMRDIASHAEFKTGEHGIVLEKGGSRAVFLPEVAVEQNWTKEQTLSYLSRKAGLDSGAWRSGASFKVFESVVFSE